MKQTYTPNFGVKATRGWCLQYVDDAGSAPSRQPNAKTAYLTEKQAGRISGSIDGPQNIWVVGFLDFTAGPFVKEGHVFFMKHLGGGRYEIRDSEVGAGARNPYGSLAEIVKWFNAYKPTYLGWSASCDGRVYATKEEEMAKPTHSEVLSYFRTFIGQDCTEQQMNYYVDRGIDILLSDLLQFNYDRKKEAFAKLEHVQKQDGISEQERVEIEQLLAEQKRNADKIGELIK